MDTDRMRTMREIVKNHSAEEIDGTLVDAWTAQHVVQIYDALNPANRAKLDAMTLLEHVSITWRLVERLRTKAG